MRLCIDVNKATDEAAEEPQHSTVGTDSVCAPNATLAHFELKVHDEGVGACLDDCYGSDVWCFIEPCDGTLPKQSCDPLGPPDEASIRQDDSRGDEDTLRVSPPCFHPSLLSSSNSELATSPTTIQQRNEGSTTCCQKQLPVRGALAVDDGLAMSPSSSVLNNAAGADYSGGFCSSQANSPPDSCADWSLPCPHRSFHKAIGVDIAQQLYCAHDAPAHCSNNSTTSGETKTTSTTRMIGLLPSDTEQCLVDEVMQHYPFWRDDIVRLLSQCLCDVSVVSAVLRLASGEGGCVQSNCPDSNTKRLLLYAHEAAGEQAEQQVQATKQRAEDLRRQARQLRQSWGVVLRLECGENEGLPDDYSEALPKVLDTRANGMVFDVHNRFMIYWHIDLRGQRITAAVELFAMNLDCLMALGYPGGVILSVVTGYEDNNCIEEVVAVESGLLYHMTVNRHGCMLPDSDRAVRVDTMVVCFIRLQPDQEESAGAQYASSLQTIAAAVAPAGKQAHLATEAVEELLAAHADTCNRDVDMQSDVDDKAARDDPKQWLPAFSQQVLNTYATFNSAPNKLQVDLHNLYVEGSGGARDVFGRYMKAIEGISQLQGVEFTVITGKGIHSDNNKPRIKQLVLENLEARRAYVQETTGKPWKVTWAHPPGTRPGDSNEGRVQMNIPGSTV